MTWRKAAQAPGEISQACPSSRRSEKSGLLSCLRPLGMIIAQSKAERWRKQTLLAGVSKFDSARKERNES